MWSLLYSEDRLWRKRKRRSDSTIWWREDAWVPWTTSPSKKSVLICLKKGGLTEKPSWKIGYFLFSNAKVVTRGKDPWCWRAEWGREEGTTEDEITDQASLSWWTWSWRGVEVMDREATGMLQFSWSQKKWDRDWSDKQTDMIRTLENNKHI